MFVPLEDYAEVVKGRAEVPVLQNCQPEAPEAFALSSFFFLEEQEILDLHCETSANFAIPLSFLSKGT